MARNKSRAKKKALTKHVQQNRRVPVFVMAKTARRVMRNTLTRNWRSKKLKLKVK